LKLTCLNKLSLFISPQATRPVPRGSHAMPVNISDFEIGRVAENARKIVGALVLPDQFKECPRYNGEGSGQSTVSKTLKQEFELLWDSNGETLLPPNEMQIFQFRNLLRNVVYLKRGCQGYTYKLASPTGAGTFFTCNNTPGAQTWLDSPRPAAFSLGQEAVHGKYMFPGYGAGHFGFWVDNYDGTLPPNAGAQGLFVLSQAPFGAGTQIRFWVWNGKSWYPFNTVTTDAVQTVASSVAPFGGAYMVAEVIAGPTASMNNVEVQVNGNGGSDVWCHRAVSNIEELLPIIQGVRVLGGVAWLRNESPELFEQGKVLAGTMSKGVPWTAMATGSSAIQATDEYFSNSAKTGYWGFLTPDDDEDFELVPDISSDAIRGVTAQVTSFPLEERSPYITATLTVGEASSNSRNFSFVSWAMIEYLTNSKIQAKAISDKTEDDWSLAVQIMKRMPNHYENKFHFDKIMEYVGSYGGPLSDMLGRVLSAFPQTAMVGNILSGNELQKGFKRIQDIAEGRGGKKMKR
jgi:hypothetical protein